MENPIKIDDLGVPLFLETPIWLYYGSVLFISFFASWDLGWMPNAQKKGLKAQPVQLVRNGVNEKPLISQAMHGKWLRKIDHQNMDDWNTKLCQICGFATKILSCTHMIISHFRVKILASDKNFPESADHTVDAWSCS